MIPIEDNKENSENSLTPLIKPFSPEHHGQFNLIRHKVSLGNAYSSLFKLVPRSFSKERYHSFCISLFTARKCFSGERCGLWTFCFVLHIQNIYMYYIYYDIMTYKIENINHTTFNTSSTYIHII